MSLNPLGPKIDPGNIPATNLVAAHEVAHVVQQGNPKPVAEKLGLDSLGDGVGRIHRQGLDVPHHLIADLVHGKPEALDMMSKLLKSDDGRLGGAEAGQSGKVVVRGWDPEHKKDIVGGKVVVRGWDPQHKKEIVGGNPSNKESSSIGQTVQDIMHSFKEKLQSLLDSGGDVSGADVATVQKSKHDAAMAAIQNTR